MTRANHPDDNAAGPSGADLLPLERPGDRVVRLATLVADVTRAVGTALPRDRDGRALVRIDCDVDGGLVIESHATGVRRLLESLVRAAVKASRLDDRNTDTPPLREVVLTAIDTGRAIEVEVADSGPPRDLVPGDVVAAERVEGSLDIVACAEGGTAITLRLPRRHAMARAA